MTQIQRGRLAVAIDTHDEPYYGKTAAVLNVTCRGRAQRGTTHFVRIASAYVIYRQMRMTLAVTFVLPEDDLLDVVKRLHQRLRQLKLHLGVLYLDKGFCCGPIIRYLQAHKQAAILACPLRGKQGGTRQLCRGRKSYRTAYTFTDGTQAQIAALATLVPGKQGMRRRKWLFFVLVHLPWSPQTVYRRYPCSCSTFGPFCVGRWPASQAQAPIASIQLISPCTVLSSSCAVPSNISTALLYRFGHHLHAKSRSTEFGD